jgi:hypothetical protein
MFERFAAYILKNRLNGLLLTLFFSAVPFMEWVGAVIMALITLRKGVLEGFIALVISAIPFVIWYSLGQQGNFYYIFLSVNCAVFILSMVLRDFASWKLTFEVGALVGLAIVCFVHYWIPDLQSYWIHLFETINGELKKDLALKVSVPNQEALFSLWASVATGVQVSYNLFRAVSYLALARWLQSMLYHPGGLQQELISIRLGISSFLVLFTLSVLCVFKIHLVLDMLPVVLTVFFLAGLSLMHFFFATQRTSSFWSIGWVVGYYILLVLLFNIVALVTILFAAIDVFINFRRRWAIRVL